LLPTSEIALCIFIELRITLKQDYFGKAFVAKDKGVFLALFIARLYF